MKKWIATGCFLVFGTILSLPLFFWVLPLLGLEIQGYHWDVLAVTAAVLALLSCLLAKYALPWNGITYGASLPLSMIFGGFCIYHDQSLPVMIGMAVCVVCCWYLVIRYTKPLSVRVPALSLGAVLIVPVCIVIFFAVLFGDFGEVRTIETVESPSGALCAQVIEHDDGALGGATIVQVRKNWCLDLYVLQITPKSKTVYRGDWYEHAHIKVAWKNEQQLIINGVDMYSISGF